VIVTCTVEFTRSSWLKSTIEKGVIEGQATYHRSLEQGIGRYIDAHPSEFADECVSPVRSLKSPKHDQSKDGIPGGSLKRKKAIIGKNDDPLGSLRRKRTGGANASAELRQPCEDNITSKTSGGHFTIVSKLSRFALPSTTSLFVIAFLALVVINAYLWLKLRDIAQKVHADDVSRTSWNLDERVDNEADILWQWLTERANGYDYSQLVNLRMQPHPDPSQRIDDALGSRPSYSVDSLQGIASSERHESSDINDQIRDLQKVIRAAEMHLQGLTKTVELGKSYRDEDELKHDRVAIPAPRSA